MRQIWIFFAPGAGGDGLANVIELCAGMHAWNRDPDQPVWRVDRVVDDQVKFWAPPVDSNWCFRTGKWFDQSQNQLNTEYERLVVENKDLVATSHDILLYNLDRSDRQDVFCHHQVSVLLDSRDYSTCRKNLVTKNLMPMDINNLSDNASHHPLYERYQSCDRSRFDRVVWIEDLDDAEFLQKWLQDLDLLIDSQMIDQYHQLRSGQWRQVLGSTQRPPLFESYVESGQIRYRSLDPSTVDQ